MSKYDDNFDFYIDGFDEAVGSDLTLTANSNYEDKPKFPITYAGQEGTYTFRIFPENYKGKPRFYRMLTTNQLQNYKKVIKPAQENRIDNLIKEAKEKGVDDYTSGFWKHKKKTEAVMMVYLISAPEGKYVQPSGSASALILSYKQLEAIKGFFAELQDEGTNIMEFLHPQKPSNAIKLTIRKQKKGKKIDTTINVSSTTSSDYELPEMSEVLPKGIEFEGLDKTYVTPNQVITDEEFEDFKTYFNDEVTKILNTHEAFDPESSETEQGYKVSFEDDEGK